MKNILKKCAFLVLFASPVTAETSKPDTLVIPPKKFLTLDLHAGAGPLFVFRSLSTGEKKVYNEFGGSIGYDLFLRVTESTSVGVLGGISFGSGFFMLGAYLGGLYEFPSSRFFLKAGGGVKGLVGGGAAASGYGGLIEPGFTLSQSDSGSSSWAVSLRNEVGSLNDRIFYQPTLQLSFVGHYF